MQKLKTQKGITLIALIITIIIMLILVGVTVSVSLNGGLFTTAKQATSQTQKQLEKERLLELVIGALDDKGKVDFANLKTAVDEDGTFKEVAASNDMGVYESIKFGNRYTVKADGTIIDREMEFPTAKWEQDGDTLTYIDADGNTTTKTIDVGDEVTYDPGTAGSYTTSADLGTGISYTSNKLNQGTYTVDGAPGTTATGALDWVVLGTNDEGQVEIISTTPTTSKLTLYGIAGYNNAITDENGNLGTLDTFCDNLYGNGYGAINARSVTLEDIYKLEYKYVSMQLNFTEYKYKYYADEDQIYRIKASQITDSNENTLEGWQSLYNENGYNISTIQTPMGDVCASNPDLSVLVPSYSTTRSEAYSSDASDAIYDYIYSEKEDDIYWSGGTIPGNESWIANYYYTENIDNAGFDCPMWGISATWNSNSSGGIFGFADFMDLIYWGYRDRSGTLHPIVTLEADKVLELIKE